jgi:hypothetical protein
MNRDPTTGLTTVQVKSICAWGNEVAIVEKEHIPGYTGFSPGKKCKEMLAPRMRSQEVDSHTQDLSVHLSYNIHGPTDTSQRFPTQSYTRSLQVPEEVLYQAARDKLEERRALTYLRGNRWDKDFGNFGNYMDSAIKQHSNLMAIGH